MLPATSAAAFGLHAGEDRTRVVLEVVEVVLDEQSRRRSRRLSYALLVIPTSAGIGLGLAASSGLSGVWLAVGALAGLIIGPPVMVAGLGSARRKHRMQALHDVLEKRAREYGLSATERRAAWKRIASQEHER